MVIDQEARDQAIEKVQKLLALAGDSAATVQEAETAARQAASLMARFNIDQAEAQLKDLLSDEPDLGTNTVCPDYYGGTVRTRTLPAWVGMLALGVGRLTQTKVDSCRADGYAAVRFSGYRSDTVYAEWLFKVLCRAVFTEAAASPFDRAGRDEFRRGAAGELQKRLYELRRQQDEDLSANLNGAVGTALAVVNRKAQVIKEHFGEQRVSKFRRPARDVSARGAGQEFGRRAAIPQGGLQDNSGQGRLR